MHRDVGLNFFQKKACKSHLSQHFSRPLCFILMNQPRQKASCVAFPDLPHGTFSQASRFDVRNAALSHVVPRISHGASSKLRQQSGGSILAPLSSRQDNPTQTGNFQDSKNFEDPATGAGCSRHFFTPRPVRRPATFIAFAHQQISRFATVPFFPFARLVLACVVFIISSVAALACDISWILPETPSDPEYRFQYWEKLGEISLGASSSSDGRTQERSISLHMGFNPADAFPSLLGTGWSLPIFESRIEWFNDSSAEIILPDGNKLPLQRSSKNKQRLLGKGWIGEVSGRQITCKASCGWVLVFRDNRLATIKTPEGIILENTVGADRSRNLVMGTQTLVSLKTNFDKQTTRKVYHLKFAGETMLLAIGQRPVWEKRKNKTVRITKIDSLEKITFQNGREEKYVLNQDELVTGNSRFKWDKETRILIEDGDKKHFIVSVKGIKCRKTQFPDGSSSLEGSQGNAHIYQFREGPLTKTVYFGKNTGPLEGKIKEVFQIKPDNSETLVRKHWYDDKGNVFKVFTRANKGNGLLYTLEKNKIRLQDNESKKILWKKFYDSNGNLSEFHAGSKKMRLKHADSGRIFVHISSEDSRKEATIPLEELDENLRYHLTFPRPESFSGN